jgi:hypothetical protein
MFREVLERAAERAGLSRRSVEMTFELASEVRALIGHACRDVAVLIVDEQGIRSPSGRGRGRSRERLWRRRRGCRAWFSMTKLVTVTPPLRLSEAVRSISMSPHDRHSAG